MRLRPMFGWSAVVLGAALAGARSAPAALGEGDKAPFFTGKEFVNTEEVSLKTLRGRLVLCEIFSTT